MWLRDVRGTFTVEVGTSSSEIAASAPLGPPLTPDTGASSRRCRREGDAEQRLPRVARALALLRRPVERDTLGHVTLGHDPVDPPGEDGDDDLVPRPDLELREDGGDVMLDGSGAHAELHGDAAIGPATRDGRRDLALTRG